MKICLKIRIYSSQKILQAADSFEDLKRRLEENDTTWSKTILKHWSTLPPVLLNVIYKAVEECKDKSPFDILQLEQKLNAKWRQSEDYKEWLRSKHDWISEEAQVAAAIDAYFQDLTLPSISDEAVVYEAPQETQEDAAPAVCPVTGQTSSTTAVCPVSSAHATPKAAVCPVTGQQGEASFAGSEGKCPFNKAEKQTEKSAGGCPFSKDQQNELLKGASCPVTGAIESLSH